MANELTTVSGELSTVADSVIFSDDGFALIQRIAQAFAASSLVPERYRGERNIGNCIIALNMAQRMGADPLSVMQNLYVVHGTPGWSAQFLIATLNKSGRFSPLRYEMVGEEGTDDWGCRAYATDLQSGERLDGPLVTIGIAKKEGWYGKRGSKWQTISELMLRYRSATWFTRTYAPEVSMGLQTVDEVHDVAKPAKSLNELAERHNNGHKDSVGNVPQFPPADDGELKDWATSEEFVASLRACNSEMQVTAVRDMFLAKCRTDEQRQAIESACDERALELEHRAGTLVEPETAEAEGELFDKGREDYA